MQGFYIDPLLAEARDPYGGPRFYPPGLHPATAQLRAEVARVRHWRAVVQSALARQLAEAPCDSERIDVAREALRNADLMEEHALRQIAMFEEGESVAKADYLRARTR